MADDEIEVTANGGRHTRVGERWDLLPTPALQAIAACMHTGTEKYGERNYHKIPVNAHLNHALRHAFLFLEGDTTEDHLVNAATRMVFALELHRRGDPGAAPPPDPEAPPVRINLADASVYCGDEALALPDGARALLVALSIERRIVERDVLCDRLWPEKTPTESHNALKMAVRRVRLQIGPRVIDTRDGGYELGPSVEVDLDEIDRLRASPINAEIPEHFERLMRGRPVSFAGWQWFAPTEQWLKGAASQFGQILGLKALQRGATTEALQIGEKLVAIDPLDEAGRKLVIAANLKRGDRAAALREYHAYQRALKDELGVEPSADVRELLAS